VVLSADRLRGGPAQSTSSDGSQHEAEGGTLPVPRTPPQARGVRAGPPLIVQKLSLVWSVCMDRTGGLCLMQVQVAIPAKPEQRCADKSVSRRSTSFPPGPGSSTLGAGRYPPGMDTDTDRCKGGACPCSGASTMYHENKERALDRARSAMEADPNFGTPSYDHDLHRAFVVAYGARERAAACSWYIDPDQAGPCVTCGVSPIHHERRA
jgi:hypothetical protein